MDGEAGKGEGMARVARASNPAWWVFTIECVKEVAYRLPYLSMDEVEALRIARRGPGTHEHRANGPLLAYAAKLGYCAPTIDWVPSVQKNNHQRRCAFGEAKSIAARSAFVRLSTSLSTLANSSLILSSERDGAKPNAALAPPDH